MEQEAAIVAQPECLKVNYLVATFNEPPRGQVFDQRSPNPNDEEMLSCRLPEVENCYSVQDGEFRLKFLMKGVLAKAAIKCQQRGRFTVQLDKEPFVAFGINYAGKLLINHTNGIRRLIFLPGRLTYDPAGVSGHPHGHEYLITESSLFIHSLVAAQVKAAQEGAPQQFIETIHRVHMEANSLYIHRPELMAWMTEQVIFACYPQQGGSQRFRHYPELVLDRAKRGEVDLNEKGRGHTKEYLEMYLKTKEGKAVPRQVRPPFQYYSAVKKNHPPEQLRAIAGDRYDNVVSAADQEEEGQGVFLFYLPQSVKVGTSRPPNGLSFGEVSRRCTVELEAYRNKMTEVDQEIITEVTLLKESERAGEKCSVF